jgi:hypothetical protein
MTRAEKRPAPESESEPRGFGTCGNRSTDRDGLKREMFRALKHWLRFGCSDFEARRIRARGAAIEKGKKR